jgi:hypothetical protein
MPYYASASLSYNYSVYLLVLMFANAYQNGPCLEIWDARVDPSKNSFYKQLAKHHPHSTRAFDK